MPQLKAYYRPTNIAETLQLLSRPGVNTNVVAGGTYITAHLDNTVDEVVDLQGLGLDQMGYRGDHLTLGAMVRLQSIIEDSRAPALLQEAAHREGPNTLRQAATVGGLVVGASQESEFLAALLVFEAEVQIQSVEGAKHLLLKEFFRDMPLALAGGLVTAVSLKTTGKTASARVGRTPADHPIVAAVARRDPGGQLHLALCGVARTPVLIDPNNVKAAIIPPGDFRGSTEYRRQMASVLSQRVINAVQNISG